MREAVIVAAVRTPIGNYGGCLADVKAVELGRIVVEEAVKRSGIPTDIIDEVLFGNVLQAGLGQNVARQVSINAGLPIEVPSTTINKVCGSGLRTISMAAQMIKAGDADCIIAGGTENMSLAPYVVDSARWGARMGDAKMKDHMVHDGLTDAFNDYHMGITAENIVDQWGLTREELDAFAYKSQTNACNAMDQGKFKDEIVPVVRKTRKGDVVVDTDEYPKHGITAEKLGKLKPAFKKDGAVTAGNASGLNDGAAAIIVMSKEKADELGIEILCTIKSYASAGVDPTIMGIGPVPAVKKTLAKANMTVEDIDLVESNEAFAAQSLAVLRDLKINPDIVNVNGGAIALGHPIGASGARIFVTLLHEMMKRDSKTGLATLCIGGGQATALLVER